MLAVVDISEFGSYLGGLALISEGQRVDLVIHLDLVLPSVLLVILFLECLVGLAGSFESEIQLACDLGHVCGSMHDALVAFVEELLDLDWSLLYVVHIDVGENLLVVLRDLDNRVVLGVVGPKQRLNQILRFHMVD